MSAIRQLLLIGHTHHDVGYTNSPRIVDRAHTHIVDRVLDLCAASPDPGPDQFRWTFEVARPVLRFLQTASPADVDRLSGYVADGRIAVTGGYLNMTQLLSEAEQDAAYDALAGLRAAGLPVRTEQHGDVNGLSWGAVEGMRRAGIDRLVMALNPDHGRPPFTQPTGFWWQGPSGHRVFVWLSTHYGFGEEWGIVDADVERAEQRIEEFVAQLAARPDYPYDTAVVHAGNDNRWPTDLFCEVVRHWNARHPDQPMRTATIDQALDALVSQARSTQIPIVRGEWADWWSHGHGSTAREVAVYREARSFARAAQTSLGLSLLRGPTQPALATVLGYRRGPVRLRDEAEIHADLTAVDEDLLLFGEHTWGSWETYSKPFSNLSHSSLNAKAAFAYGAYDVARDLALEGMFRLLGSGADDTCPRADGRVAAVLNHTERERTEPVVVEVDGARRVRAVATVPAFGVALVPLPQDEPRCSTGRQVQTDRYRVVVDPARGGVVSLTDRRTGRELVDPAVPHGLGAVVVEQVRAGSTHPMLARNPKDFHPDRPGPEFDHLVATGGQEPEILDAGDHVQIRWRTTPPGLPPATTTLTLYPGLDAIDLEVDLAKPERFGPESIFVAFPFLVPDAEHLLETAGAVFAADTEQLPDTSKDWYSIQHAVGVNGATHAVLWGSFDAPLVQVGGFHTGRWARELQVEGGHVNSWLMNNLHFTNFQARQEGTHRYRYRFAATSAPVSRERVRVYGRDLLEPLQARQYEGPIGFLGASGLRVEPAEAVLAEVRPTGADQVRVRLRNPGDQRVDVTVSWSDGVGAPGGAALGGTALGGTALGGTALGGTALGGSVQGGRTVHLEPHGVADVLLHRAD